MSCTLIKSNIKTVVAGIIFPQGPARFCTKGRLHSDNIVHIQALQYAVRQSCINKAEVVAADEKEGGVRATLNLGHTFGHAMETWQGYGDSLLLEPCLSASP